MCYLPYLLMLSSLTPSLPMSSHIMLSFITPSLLTPSSKCRPSPGLKTITDRIEIVVIEASGTPRTYDSPRPSGGTLQISQSSNWSKTSDVWKSSQPITDARESCFTVIKNIRAIKDVTVTKVLLAVETPFSYGLGQIWFWSKINILVLQFWIRSTVYNTVKGIVQRILSGVETRLILIHAGKLEADPLFFLNFKGTPSQQEHKTFSAA
jgi:hypothetical protein